MIRLINKILKTSKKKYIELIEFKNNNKSNISLFNYNI